MKRFLLSLIILLAMPSFANARGYYLILSKKGTGLERIKMADLKECEELGEQWDEVSRGHTYICLESK